MRAWNALLPFAFTFLAFSVSGAVLYVDVNGAQPTPPYTDWSTAATNIQDAVGLAQAGDTVLVTNGVYDAGGATVPLAAVTNRVALTNAITLLSVSGPQATIIRGRGTSKPGQAPVRCAYIGSNAVLSGFTLTNGQSGGAHCQDGAVVSNCVIVGCTDGSGAGAYRGTLYNCLIAQNTAASAPGMTAGGGGALLSTLYNCILSNNVASQTQQGGGAYQCTLYNCVLERNYAHDGGGAAYSVLKNCTVSANTATNEGGGVYGCTSDNCILYFNSAPYGSDGYLGSVDYCCVFCFPLYACPNTVTNEPLFVNLAAGDLHLQSNSPCINSGNSAYAFGGTDLDDNPRIVGGAVDIGAYEFQHPGSVISYAWLQQYGFPMDGSADYADPDGDGMNNWQEWIAGTNPTNASSALRILGLTATNNPSGVAVSWQSVSGRIYYVERSTNLAAQAAFQTVDTNIAGQAGTTVFTDSDNIGSETRFYRVGVQR